MRIFFRFRESDYLRVYEELVQIVKNRDWFRGSVALFIDDVECRLRCVASILRTKCNEPDATTKIVVEPLWYEMTTYLGDEVLPNDFDFEEMIDLAA